MREIEESNRLLYNIVIAYRAALYLPMGKAGFISWYCTYHLGRTQGTLF